MVLRARSQIIDSENQNIKLHNDTFTPVPGFTKMAPLENNAVSYLQVSGEYLTDLLFSPLTIPIFFVQIARRTHSASRKAPPNSNATVR
jgi:hypothetical protein